MSIHIITKIHSSYTKLKIEIKQAVHSVSTNKATKNVYLFGFQNSIVDIICRSNKKML